ncbi:hypothetical protein [Brumimicrobium mesophilum]|uniref:hypothetical protein n=1 Tax=Brumimicrobium mesophilum TaxID=392717 RepID=UPI000D14289C|nr:hypothetical protein [Brumimicrobium mesophilum]
MKNLLIIMTLICLSNFSFAQASDFNFEKTACVEPLSAEYQLIYDSLLPKENWKKVKFTNDCVEMLYYIRNFEDEAKRNANINWDRGYVRSIKWIRWNLCKQTDLFAEEIKDEIESDLKRLRRFRKPYTENDIYVRLNRRVIEYYLNSFE